MMRSIRTTAVVALCALAFIQCGGDQKAPESPVETMPSAEPPVETDGGAVTRAPTAAEVAVPVAEAPAPPAAPKPDPLTDGQIAAITEAANSSEIAQAKLAQSKSKSADIKKFAAMMIAHHGEAKQKQAKLKLAPEDSGVSTSMAADSASTLNALKADTGADFDKAYITAQVDGHQKVLDTINDRLLPSAKSPELKAYLEEIKPKVEAHLKEAKRLQMNLDNQHQTAGTRAGSAG
jgi:putative membrane protein